MRPTISDLKIIVTLLGVYTAIGVSLLVAGMKLGGWWSGLAVAGALMIVVEALAVAVVWFLWGDRIYLPRFRNLRI